MKQYEVTITETLQTNVTVEADSLAEAEDIVEKQWKAGEHILDADNFTDVTFSCATDSPTQIDSMEATVETMAMG